MLAAVSLLALSTVADGLRVPAPLRTPSRALLRMVTTDKPSESGEKKLQKVELIKLNSNYLHTPLQEELGNDEIFVSPDAVVVLKYHGSYMQDNRDNRKKDKEKEYSFMLRLKSPCGEVPPQLHQILDDLADKFGQGDLRATTRQAWQLHGILKGDLKTVISTIMAAGSSTVGACGDVSRNVMCTPAPFTSPAYQYARQYSKVMAELFKPQSNAFTELWNGEEKVAAMEYWMKDIQAAGFDIKAAMTKNTGTGIITSDPVEPLYGNRYLPRKFKMAVTVPGDNSLDIYTNDVGLVVITDDATGKLLGFNVMVGGGMGRTHMKDTTFARVADHLGFVAADDVMELCKSILAAQRDHGNRDVRPNARMKYLVHTKGIDDFRKLVETYFGKPIEPWREIGEWKYSDWMGWHEQGDGKWFLGVNIEQGRVKNADGVNVKTALRRVVDELGLTMILSPTQSIIFKDVAPAQKARLDAILAEEGIKPIEDVEALTRLSMACPALPLCGLAVAEAERRMPEWVSNVRSLMNRLGLEKEEIMLRMTGCPNGCARPYMSELALVGDGPESYQVWVGGSPRLTRVSTTYKDRVKWAVMDATLEPLLVHWRDARQAGEAFGDFCNRQGVAKLAAFAETYKAAP
jgi:sulfite reductase (ferredoxin)